VGSFSNAWHAIQKKLRDADCFIDEEDLASPHKKRAPRGAKVKAAIGNDSGDENATVDEKEAEAPVVKKRAYRKRKAVTPVDGEDAAAAKEVKPRKPRAKKAKKDEVKEPEEVKETAEAKEQQHDSEQDAVGSPVEEA
jgi:hypothetical protein